MLKKKYCKQKRMKKRSKIDVITNLPSANRSIQDATRLLPEANLNSFEVQTTGLITYPLMVAQLMTF
jgi:predicted transcriptional regulator